MKQIKSLWLWLLISIGCMFGASWAGFHLVLLALGYGPLEIEETRTWLAWLEVGFASFFILIGLIGYALCIRAAVKLIKEKSIDASFKKYIADIVKEWKPLSQEEALEVAIKNMPSVPREQLEATLEKLIRKGALKGLVR